MNPVPALDPSAARAATVDEARAARAAAVPDARVAMGEKARTAREATVGLYAAARPAVAMAGLSSAQLVELIREGEAGIRSLEAARTLALARLAATEEVVLEDGTIEEVSQGLGYRRLDAPDLVSDVLGLSSQAAGARVDDAVVLATKLPTLVDAMGAGRVDAYRAGIIATELRDAPRAVCDEVLARVDGYLAKPGWVLRQRTRRALEVLDKDCLISKTKRARSALGLRMVPNEDSTDTWTAILPTEQSREAWAAIEPLAKQIRDTHGCTLDVARSQAMTQLMLGNCSGTFHVHFAVPADQAEGFAARFTGQPTDPSTPTGDGTGHEPEAGKDGTTPDPANDPVGGDAWTDDGQVVAEPADAADDSRATTPTDDSGPAAMPDCHVPADESNDLAFGGDDPNLTRDDALESDLRDDPAAKVEDKGDRLVSGGVDAKPTSNNALDSDLRDDHAAAGADEWAVVTGLGTAGTTIVPAVWLSDLLAGKHGHVEADVIGCDPVTGGFVTEPKAIPIPEPDRGETPPARRAGSMPSLVTKAYRPTRACRAYVTARDQRCRFPGCTNSVYFSDLDHVRAWPLGPTAPGNLACLCRRHHRIKQRPGWTVRMNPDGSMDWTDPTGTVRTTHPVDHLGTTQPTLSNAALPKVSAISSADFGDTIWNGDYHNPNAYTGGVALWLAAQRDLADRMAESPPRERGSRWPDPASPLEAHLIPIFHARLDRPEIHRHVASTPRADYRWLAS